MKECSMHFPFGKDFIFTIFDDTDVATLDYIRPIYDYLSELGIYTTKTVWPLSYDGPSDFKGSHTLQNHGYAQYILELKSRGFEIGFHGPSMVTMDRFHTKLSFDIFHQVLSSYPRIYAAHSSNRENLYWGASRFSTPVFRLLYSVITRTDRTYYQGHVENTPYFWGDLALLYIDYMRSFTYKEINLFNISKSITYQKAQSKWVKNWFITGDADNVEEFNQLLSVNNQYRLEQEHGVCIISTHLGKGFLKRNGILNENTRILLKEMSKRNGWFVPVSVVLDFIRSKQHLEIDNCPLHLFRLEMKWLLAHIRDKGKVLPYEKTELSYLRSS